MCVSGGHLVEKGVVERSHLCGFGDALAEYFDFEVSMGSVQRYRHGRQLRRLYYQWFMVQGVLVPLEVTLKKWEQKPASSLAFWA